MLRNYYSLHKVGHACVKHHIPIIPVILKLIKIICFPACDIPFATVIGDDCSFPHRAIGVVIHSGVIIGAHTKIETNVTIGGIENKGIPRIGDNVLIGTGASVLGSVTVGDNAKVGAGAVVIYDVPSGCTAVGVPAHIVATREHEEYK